MRRPLLFLLLAAASASEWSVPRLAAAAPAVQLATEIVTANRIPQPHEHLASTVRVLDEETLRLAPTATLDGALRALPGFSLFRRSDSFTANPTAQGVSLRGLGPSGASRSLVLLDGVPLNDPFGGWVAWTKVPRENLRRIEVVPGGGAAAWGNAALGGVVQVLGAAGDNKETRTTATIGDFGTHSIEFSHTQPVGQAKLDLAANAFSTDGFALVAPERRGPIDVAAWSRHHWLTGRWRQPLGEALDFAATVRSYDEERGNGTPYQRNGTREKFGSIAVNGRPSDGFAWHAVAYAQDQSFASTFSGVNATRTAETPASDQFAVPAVAVGAAWTGTWKHQNHYYDRTSIGADIRSVRGETREYFTFVGGNFTRLRVAGGKQSDVGLFAIHSRDLFGITHGWQGTVGTRLDFWRDTDGHRRESDRNSGASSRDDRYPDQTGATFSPNVGVVWRPVAHRLRFRINAQESFRRPTLNELYRPFRQGANVTEANAALRTERNTSGEIGVEWVAVVTPEPPLPEGVVRLQYFVPPPPRPALTLGATAFWNDLRDAVGNVTLARGPGTFPIVGVLAAGGIGRQRLNLDHTRTQGIELSATWNANGALSLNAAALFNEATVRRAATSPALVGKQVAQVPRRSTTLGATWRAPAQITFTPRLRWIGRQFEDDENTLRLGETVVVDLGVTRPLTSHLSLFLTAENLGNARVETGRSADGIVNTGTPRFIMGGLRGRW